MSRVDPQRHGIAWIALCLAFVLHVTDEALTGFLDVYNPAVQAIRDRVPALPLPTFTFGVWLAALVTAVGILLLLSPLVFRGARGMRPLSLVFGAVMLANGLLHVGGSIALARVLPGVYSSPILVAAALWLLHSIRRVETPLVAAP